MSNKYKVKIAKLVEKICPYCLIISAKHLNVLSRSKVDDLTQRDADGEQISLVKKMPYKCPPG